MGSPALPKSKLQKRKTTKVMGRSYMDSSVDVEMRLAAAEALANWEVLSDAMGVQRIGNDGPRTPHELIEWFLRVRRH
jgi:hypothetical protein